MSNQKPRTIEEQIKLLRSRRMQFSNEEYAKECLSHISYFRQKYYWTDMIDEETEHDFLEDASFDDVITEYSTNAMLFISTKIIPPPCAQETKLMLASFTTIGNT